MSKPTPGDWFMRAMGCILIILFVEATALFGVMIFALARMGHL